MKTIEFKLPEGVAVGKLCGNVEFHDPKTGEPRFNPDTITEFCNLRSAGPLAYAGIPPQPPEVVKAHRAYPAYLRLHRNTQLGWYGKIRGEPHG